MVNNVPENNILWPPNLTQLAQTARALVKISFPDAVPDGAEHAAEIVILETRYSLHDQQVVEAILNGEIDHEKRLALMHYARLTYNRDLAQRINEKFSLEGIIETLNEIIGEEVLHRIVSNTNTGGGHYGRYLESKFVVPVEAPTATATPEEIIITQVNSHREFLRDELKRFLDSLAK